MKSRTDKVWCVLGMLIVGGCALRLTVGDSVIALSGSVEAASQGSSTKSSKHSASHIDWRLEKTTGDKPSARDGGKWVPVGNQLVMFGGFYECFDKDKCEHTYFDEVYTFDATTNKWEKKLKSSTGALPEGRVFLGAAPYKKKNTAIFFGGGRYNAKVTSYRVYDDMWEYNPKTDTIVQRTYANQGPVARLGGEIVIKDHTLYLFGGYDTSFKAHNDLWSYDLLTDTWKQLKQDNDPPSPSKRYIFRFELSPSGEDIYIFGGNYREKFTIQRNDTWKYNMATNTFTELVSEKVTNIPGRTHGTCTFAGDTFVIALGDIPNGGCFTNQASEHQNPTNEVWKLRPGSSQYEQVKIGFGPPPLKRVYYAQVGDRLYITHGFNYKCDNKETEGPIYNLDMHSLPLKQIH